MAQRGLSFVEMKIKLSEAKEMLESNLIEQKDFDEIKEFVIDCFKQGLLRTEPQPLAPAGALRPQSDFWHLMSHFVCSR